MAGYAQVEAAEGLALVAWEEVLGDDVSATLRGLPAEIEHGDQGAPVEGWLTTGRCFLTVIPTPTW